MKPAHLALLLALACFLPACQPYQLTGRVIHGQSTEVAVVNADDPRLDAPGLEQTSLQFTIDPDTLGRHTLAPVAVQPDGSFAVPIPETGAGFLQYDLGVVARHPDYQTAQSTVPLPSAGKRLLIILAPGVDTYQAPVDPFENTEHFLNQMK